MTDTYDTTKYSQQDDLERHELAGEFEATITGCKLVKNSKTNDDQFLVSFQIGEAIHYERFTMNERFGWIFDRFLKDLGLGYSERQSFHPSNVIGLTVHIELEQNGQYLKLKSVRPMTSKPYSPAEHPARGKDIPF